MSPRPYRLGQRQAATEQTRAKILEAARLLLSAEAGVAGFTIDAVARQAGVARMTVYYQFSSKRGLLEALFDDLANRSLVSRLIPALQTPEPRAALQGIIEAFAGFWAAERLVMRRVRSLAALDPEVDESVRARDERRREHLRRIVARMQPASDSPPTAGPPAAPEPDVADILHTLTSFEMFDTLAGASRPIETATASIHRLAWLALGLPADPAGAPGKSSRSSESPEPSESHESPDDRPPDPTSV